MKLTAPVAPRAVPSWGMVIIPGAALLVLLAVAAVAAPGARYILAAAAGLGLVAAFFAEPFSVLLLYVFLIPVSYIVTAGLETSILRPVGLFMLACTLPTALWRWRGGPIRVAPLGRMIAIFVLACLLSVYSFIEVESALLGVLLFAGNALFCAAVVFLVFSEQRLEMMVWTVMLSLGLSAGWGVLQRFTSAELFRLTGTVGDPNYFAALLLPGVSITLYRFWQDARLIARLFFGLLALAITIAIALTTSRGAAVVVIPLVIVLFLRNRHGGQLLLLLGAVGLVLLVILPRFGFSIIELEHILTRARLTSLSQRWTMVISGWRMFLDHPVLGVGADNFIYVFHRYSLLPPLWRAMSAHNTLIEVLAGTGLVGFLPFLGIIGITLRNYWWGAQQYRRLGQTALAMQAESLFFAFLSVVVNLLFLTWQHSVILWLLIALSRVVERQAQSAVAQAALRAGPDPRSASAASRPPVR